MARPNPRNPRSYHLREGHDLPVSSSMAARPWRWRTELGLAVLIPLGTVLLGHRIGAWQAVIAVAGFLVSLFGATPTRHWLTRRVWCVISRHRLQRLFCETTLHTYRGRLPLILWIRPGVDGERALIWCRAGLAAESFVAYAGEIRAACYARGVRVRRHARWAHLVTLEIVRYEPADPAHGIRPAYRRADVIRRDRHLLASSSTLASSAIARTAHGVSDHEKIV